MISKKNFCQWLIFLLLILPGCTRTPASSLPAEKATSLSENNLHNTALPSSGNNNNFFRYDNLPPYSGYESIAINGGIPFFTTDDLTTDNFENYSELDELGRCGTAFANICLETMPTEERGKIGNIKPTGWHTIKYDIISDRYLYNRCHLIGYQLAGENANEKNLITGTRYLNLTGMLPWETLVADYVKETGNHVLYRATPHFTGTNLVASGVLLEAYSVEDEGTGICFNTYCYNIQPGIIIDYSTGESRLDEPSTVPEQTQEQPQTNDYILNKNTKKFHYPTCPSVQDIKDKNKKYITENREALIENGYKPCSRCNP